MAVPSVRLREGEKGDVARARDRDADLALVLRAVARDAAGGDLAAIGDELLEGLRVLVVDGRGLVRAVLADALARAAATEAVVEVGRAVAIDATTAHVVFFH